MVFYTKGTVVVSLNNQKRQNFRFSTAGFYIYEMPFLGELTKEEDVLEWLVQHKSTGDEEDVIEDVTLKTLTTLINSVDHLAVLFCKHSLKLLHK